MILYAVSPCAAFSRRCDLASCSFVNTTADPSTTRRVRPADLPTRSPHISCRRPAALHADTSPLPVNRRSVPVCLSRNPAPFRR